MLPLLAHSTLHGGADVFGLLTSAMGAGAVLGGLLVATFSVTGIAPLTAAAVGFGLAILAAALVPTLATELVALVLVGAASTAFMATGNSTLQLTSDPSFRGRVMALWAVTFQGSTPIGGPIIGSVSEYASPRFGLALGALACLLGAALGATALRRTPPGERSTTPGTDGLDHLPAGTQRPVAILPDAGDSQRLASSSVRARGRLSSGIVSGDVRATHDRTRPTLS